MPMHNAMQNVDKTLHLTIRSSRYERRGDNTSSMDLASTIGGGRFGRYVFVP